MIFVWKMVEQYQWFGLAQFGIPRQLRCHGEAHCDRL